MLEDAVLVALKEKKGGLSFPQLAGFLRLRGRSQTRLRAALKTLQKKGRVYKKKDHYVSLPDKTVLRGEFLSSGRGYGFVRTEGGDREDVFVPARHSLGALDGDRVEITVRERGKKGKPEGQVARLLKKGRQTLLGVFLERYGRPYLAPFDSPAEEIPLATTGPFDLSPGVIVEADRDTLAVREVLGRPDDPGVDTRVVIKRFGLETDFSPGGAAEARETRRRISAPDKEGRVDYRDWTAVTIDGETAQDFDDAVSIRKLPSEHFFLGVHIADVSHYVRPGSALDRDARLRATSVYFPGLTLPMLPEELSNDLCSLRPRKTRLTVTALLEIDGKGRIIKAEFHPSVIKTVERMTYTSVFKIFQGDVEERRRYRALVPDFLLMRELASILRARREEQGSLNFDLLEPELVYQDGRLQSVAAFEANEAHHLIEEFMVAANEAVAGYLDRTGRPSLYRVHPPPGRADLEELADFLDHFGWVLPKPEKTTSKNLQRTLRQVEGKPGEKVIQQHVLRALRLAVYAAENTGHYGLAKEDYTHFTSPIRRYPDLIVHRALKAELRGEKETLAGLAELALHCSERERKADEAEKELVGWRIFRFLKGKLGEEFPGLIVDINKAGVVVELEDFFVNGLIPFPDLGGDYFHRTSTHQLVGRRSGRRFEIGQRVTVILAAVDPQLRRMTLVLSREGRGESS
ncbi:MAG: ribonuclease R [Candidatus Aminicenantales bacterium]